MVKPVIVALVGPTGVGKTHVAIRLCGELNAEIVSMDSMQIYRSMDIGTAKPTLDERRSVPHHLIDVVDPGEVFTVAKYRKLALEAIDGILSRGRLPLLVGGTGLYLNAISYEMHLGEKECDRAKRESLRRIAEGDGGKMLLYARLAELDPVSAAKLHPNDVRRVIRALEVFESCGKAISDQSDINKQGPYCVLVYGLSLPRKMMYERIDARVDEMLRLGLEKEVASLIAQGIKPHQEGGAMQAIGYKELAMALMGEISKEQAIFLIKRNSRRYAKRQLTWFRHDERVRWFDWTAYEDEDMLLCALFERIRADIQLAAMNDDRGD